MSIWVFQGSFCLPGWGSVGDPFPSEILFLQGACACHVEFLPAVFGSSLRMKRCPCSGHVGISQGSLCWMGFSFSEGLSGSQVDVF